MSGTCSQLKSIIYENGMLSILDQLRLPEESVYIPIPNIATAWEAIKSMKVRGAPAIGIVAGLSVAMELRNKTIQDYSELEAFLEESFDYLITSRPTAVNMADMKQRLTFMLNDRKHKSQPQEIKSIVLNWLENEFHRDIEINKKMSSYGADKLIELCTEGISKEKKPLRILTHCNTGSLATAGYGTALGVIRQLHERGMLDKAFATETRPYNQGSRLTAFELIYESIPHLLICDSMAASAIQTHNIDAIVVGADRIFKNGDTCNKIGTFQLSILAKHFNIPFMVVAPTTSFDFKLNAETVKIEERPQEEMIRIGQKYLSPKDVSVWNPAFDITPFALITGGIATEFGHFRSDQIESKLMPLLNHLNETG